MNRQQYHKTIHYYLSLLVAFSMPFARLTPVFIVLIFVNWLLEGDIIEKLGIFIRNKVAVFFTLLYLVHLIGLVYSQNLDKALFDLQVKLSLLLFPIIYSSRPLHSKQIAGVLTALTAGAIVSCLLLLSYAINLYVTENIVHFDYQNYSILMHPSYLAMYINLVIAWLLLKMALQKKTNNKLTFGVITILLFLIFNLVLLASKSGLLVLLLLLMGYWGYIVLIKKNFKALLLALIVTGTTIGAIYTFLPKVSIRINEVFVTLKKGVAVEEQGYESTANRLLIWKSGKKIVKKHLLLGVGQGDVKEALKSEYTDRKMVFAYNNELNAHSAFLQITLGLGLVGLTVLLGNLLVPLYLSVKKKNYLYAIFVGIIIINFLPESMLEVQAGTMFYGFFNSLLFFNNENKS